MTPTKTIKLSPGASIHRKCEFCGWTLHVYLRSKTSLPGETIPPADAIPIWWQTVCLCGHRTYEPASDEWEQQAIQWSPNED